MEGGIIHCSETTSVAATKITRTIQVKCNQCLLKITAVIMTSHERINKSNGIPPILSQIEKENGWRDGGVLVPVTCCLSELGASRR